MKREKKLTKRERKAQNAAPAGAAGHDHHQHIHCIACGRHIDEEELETGGKATVVTCAHGSSFAACVTCEAKAQALLDEHDRTGKPVQVANAWH